MSSHDSMIPDVVVSLADIRREILSDFTDEEQRRLTSDVTVDVSLVPANLKVSCPFGDRCTSPSRRDQSRRRSWLCGSNASHDDRVCGCVAYVRLDKGLLDGQSGNRRFPK